MEAVSKVVNAATAALWGDGSTAQQQSTPHGEEPIAGVQGSGEPNDPYDAGNREEQPEASISEGNTAPQEPRLDGAKTDPTRKDLLADVNANDVDITKTAPTAPITASATLTSPALSPVPVAGVATSSTPAETGASSSAVTSEPKTEQRIIESTAGQSSQAPRATGHQEVSEEALKGPQGPPPVPAEEFEEEAKGMKSAKKENGPVENGSSKSPDKSSQGSGNGKHSPLHKMKEKLSKVAHPRHGSNKA